MPHLIMLIPYGSLPYAINKQRGDILQQDVESLRWRKEDTGD